MSKKNSSVQNLKILFKNDKKIVDTYQIFKKNLNSLNKNKSFVVGVSGGADSLSLCALMKTFSNETKVKVFYVLIDHGIRKNSNKEAKQVRALLKKKKISLTIIKNKEKINKNIQGRAREVRYKLLSIFSKKNNAKYILTAHHSDDQIETFLIRLSRGSGIQGLSSMKKITKLNKATSLIRPLLDLKKKDLKYLAKIFFGKVFKDPSNNNTKYLRTRIRVLRRKFDKIGIHHDQIIRSIKNLASANETLNGYIDKIFKKNVKNKKNEVLINFQNISQENFEIQLRVLSTAIKNFTKTYYPPRSKKIKNLINLLTSAKQKKLTLSGCILEKSGKYLSIKKEA
jgi:tRNA(Ile)-lysidine synthase